MKIGTLFEVVGCKDKFTRDLSWQERLWQVLSIDLNVVNVLCVKALRQGLSSEVGYRTRLNLNQWNIKIHPSKEIKSIDDLPQPNCVLMTVRTNKNSKDVESVTVWHNVMPWDTLSYFSHKTYFGL